MAEKASSPGEDLPETPIPRPDYSFWTQEGHLNFPHFTLFESRRELTGVWQHGFRVSDTRVMPVKAIWVCCICARQNAPCPEVYTYMGVNCKGIRDHMLRSHGIDIPKVTPKRTNESEAGTPNKRRRSTASKPTPNKPIPGQEQSLSELLPRGDLNADEQAHLTQWDEKKYKVLLLDWLTHSNLPFSVVQSKQFKRLLLYNNPSLRDECFPSADTLIRELDAEYHQALVLVHEVLQNARSRIHYTLEGSTSFFGVNAHFTDNQWCQWKILLATPAQIDSQTGDALANEVAAILNSLKIKDSIGYFTIPNVSKYDTSVAALGREFDFDPSVRRIRCAPHFIDLVAKTMMYGTKKDNFTRLIAEWKDSSYHDEKGLKQLIDALDGFYSLEDAEQQLHATEFGARGDDITYPIPSELTAEEMDNYKKNGPFGKLHNIGIHMHHSSQFREAFIDAQHQTNSPDELILDFPRIVSASWESDEDMASLVWSRQRALNRMFSNIEASWLSQGGKPENKPSILNERLSPSEWQIVEILRKVLQLFKVASNKLQGTALGRSTNGNFEDYFPVIEMLLDHLETVSQGYIIEEEDDKMLVKKQLFDAITEDTRFTLLIYIKLGLRKLEDYYSKLTSAAYAGAVVFHPCKKWEALGELWGQSPARKTGNWKGDYERSFESIWESDYKNTLNLGKDPSEPRHEVADIIERRLAFKRSLSCVSSISSQDYGNIQDSMAVKAPSVSSELELYLSEPTIKSAAYQTDPIAWWRDIGSRRFPRLSHMAVDLLTIPSSSAGEGGFSCGHMTASPRTRLHRHVVGMAQCLRSWAKSGIYQSSLPLDLLESENWPETWLLTPRDSDQGAKGE